MLYDIVCRMCMFVGCCLATKSLSFRSGMGGDDKWMWVARGNSQQISYILSFGLMLLRLGNVTIICMYICMYVCIHLSCSFSTCLSINQSINQSINRSINQSINQPTNQPTNQSIITITLITLIPSRSNSLESGINGLGVSM